MATLADQIGTLIKAHEQAIAAMYKNTQVPVRDILLQYGISYNKLYRILRDAEVPLRKPQAHEIVVLDKNNDNAPTWVERTPATLKLRERQIEDAYYGRQEIVTTICSKFHISWRTLYRICPPNRRKFSIPGTPSKIEPSTPD